MAFHGHVCSGKGVDHPELELTYPLYVEMELCWTNNAQQICTKCIPNSTIKLIMAY